MQSKLGVVLMLVALGLLIPGIYQPILSMTGTVDKEAVVEVGMQTLTEDPDVPNFMVSLAEQLVDQLDLRGSIPVYEKSRSILGTVEELYRAKQWLVAFLIALFSIVVPVVKSALMIISGIISDKSSRVSRSIIRLISKWSMADVFVVAIIVAFLAANATQQTEKLFSFNAEFGDGFYYFLGYCLLSVLSMQIMDYGMKESSGSNVRN